MLRREDGTGRRQGAAAATSPRNSPASSRVSGCHWTATSKRSPRRSMASRVPSAACAAASKPGCARTDWWWWQPTCCRSPTSRRSRDPDSGRRPRWLAEGVAARVSALRGRPGRACAGRATRRRARPSPACPRQTPSTGGRARPRRRGARAPRRPGPVASRPCAGAGAAPYGAGSTSAPPVMTSASSRATTAAAAPEPGGGSSTAAPPAARPRRRTGVVQAGRRLVPHPPAGLLAVAGQPDRPRGHFASCLTAG